MEVSRRAKTEKSMSSLVTVIFDCNCVVHHEFLPQGRRVNKEYYLEVISRLRQVIRQKRLELWKNETWILDHAHIDACA